MPEGLPRDPVVQSDRPGAVTAVASMGPPGLLVTAGATLGGWGIGRAFWSYLERLGERRVKKLAADLADQGRSLTP